MELLPTPSSPHTQIRTDGTISMEKAKIGKDAPHTGRHGEKAWLLHRTSRRWCWVRVWVRRSSMLSTVRQNGEQQLWREASRQPAAHVMVRCSLSNVLATVGDDQ